MSMRSVIANATIEKDGVHYLMGQGCFSYSDGDWLEKQLLAALRKASDLSSTSRELEAFGKGWAFRYHTSRYRSVPYRSLRIGPEDSVLEVGSGCGAITRLLGERAGEVVALEGSGRRAIITRERTSGQENVSVLCASFAEVEFKKKFDLIVCNGVLEYAGMFVCGPNPASRMIALMRSLLNPGGSLVVAIENQFGLKYFGNSREDHTGVMFDGIEGYARYPGGPRTFGKSELEEMLHLHFEEVEFFLPLPDYKFPRAIIREALLDEVDCSELFASTGSGPSGYDDRPSFHERIAWRQLAKNRMLGTHANSFFVLAGSSGSSRFNEDWRGDIYSIGRAEGLETKTTISCEIPVGVTVEKQYAFTGETLVDADFSHAIGAKSAWVNGKSVHAMVSETLMEVTKEPISVRLKPVVLLWWQALPRSRRGDDLLDGNSLDLNWENSLVADQGICFFDAEWSANKPIDAAWVIYRVVSRYLDSEWRYRHLWSSQCRGMSKWALLGIVFKITGVGFTSLILWRVIRSEAAFQNVASGRVRPTYRVFIEDRLPFPVLYGWQRVKGRIVGIAGRVKRNLHRLTNW